MRILLIEDETAVADNIRLVLEKNNMIVDIASTGEDGLCYFDSYEYGLAILDLNLPDIHGFEIVKRIRNNKNNLKKNLPILILSGYEQVENKIKGLTFGADDYLTKPFNNNELIVRINTILRRTSAQSTSIIKVGDLEVNIDSHTVLLNGEVIHLTAKEYLILKLLALKNGQTISKEQILNHLYNEIDDEPDIKIVDVFICKLRKKLGMQMNSKSYIETVWGMGYKLTSN